MRYRLASIATAWLLLTAADARSCMVDRSGPMPVCSAPASSRGERVVIVTGDSRVPTNISIGKDGGRDGPTAKLIDLNIAAGSGPLHLVLSSYHASIYRFTGSTDQVARVTVLGAIGHGPKHFGIVGIPQSKIAQTPVTGRDSRRSTSCGAPPRACVPDQFFDYAGGIVDQQNRFGRANWPSYWFRKTPDHVVRLGYDSIGSITISNDLPHGRMVERRSVASSTADYGAREKRRAAMTDLEIHREDNPAPVVIDPLTVFSPLELIADEVPTSWEGLAFLEARGVIHGATSQVFASTYRPWAERLSARLNSPLDPAFKLAPAVDFVVTAPMRIPRDLQAIFPKRTVAFLVAPGVPEPESPPYSGHCVFFADDRISKSSDCSASSAMDAATVAAYAAARRTTQLQASAARRGNACRIANVDADTKIIGIATYAGVDEQDPTRLGVMGCTHDSYHDRMAARGLFPKRTDSEKKRTDSEKKYRCPEGRVSVEVRTPGRVFLFLQSDRAAKWQLSAAPGTEIVGAMSITDFKVDVDGLPAGAKFEQVFSDTKDACNSAFHLSGLHFGGPSAEVYSHTVQIAVGRPLDRFVRNPLSMITGDGPLFGEGGYVSLSKLAPDRLMAYSRFVID